MSRMMLSVILVAAMGLAGLSHAATLGFDELDKDDDGMLSRSEAARSDEIDFAKADTNKDGMIDRAEYESAVG